ncbi:MAG: hydroxymethylbilane synthase [Rickettsiales bacterium]
MQTSTPKGKRIRVGTRASALAQAQADQTIAKLATMAGEDVALEKVLFTTTGDKHLEGTLAEMGGNKGLFTKEIEEALLRGDIEIAVHSMKDVETKLPDGLVIAAMLPREDARDALISKQGWTLKTLPKNAIVGTSSLRRAALLWHKRPDLKIVPFRGNVLTRLRKLDDSVADATILAMAGINRLGLKIEGMHVLEVDEYVPAVAQGAIGLQCRDDDTDMMLLLEKLNHDDTFTCVTAERSMLAVLDGSCRTPIAGYATLENNEMLLKGLVLKPDGSAAEYEEMRFVHADSIKAGEAVAEALLQRIGKDFFRVR